MPVTFGTFLKCHMKEIPKLRDIELKLWREDARDIWNILKMSHEEHS
jgi:hypothetical protein